jgi:hypothetical protein
MAEGHLCITYGRILDAEVAFGHDKSFKNDTFHFYEKALWGLVYEGFFTFAPL